MKTKNLMLPALIIGLVSVSIGTFNTFAYQGDYTKTGPNYTAERHDTMQKAFTTNDYESWKAQMESTNSGKRVLSVINKDNFAKFAEANKLGLEGKTVEANKIREELGLGNGGGKGRTGGCGGCTNHK